MAQASCPCIYKANLTAQINTWAAQYTAIDRLQTPTHCQLDNLHAATAKVTEQWDRISEFLVDLITCLVDKAAATPWEEMDALATRSNNSFM